jgi:hypothetical protein
MAQKWWAVSCEQCHKIRTEEIRPNVFLCRPCKVIIVVEGTDTSSF